VLGHSYANPDHFHFIHLCSDSRNGCDFRALNQMKEQGSIRFNAYVSSKCGAAAAISSFVPSSFKFPERWAN
jgi:hypothetical protein